MIPIGNISIIGPGRVGQTLGRALANKGCRISDVIGRRDERVQQAVEFIGNGRGSTRLSELSDEFQVLLMAVPDDNLEEMAAELSTLEVSLSHKWAFHFSGSQSSEVLKPLAARGMHTGSMHPLMSFPDPATALQHLPGIYYCLEGDAEAVAVAQQLVVLLEGKHFSIATEHKPLYHSAAVLACGQMIALLDIAFSLWRSIGVDPDTTRAALLPLIKSAVAGVEQLGPQKALTGPFSRGDLSTIEKHLRELGRLNQQYAEIYTALGQHALTLSRVSDERKAAIQRILLDQPSRTSQRR
ncbi:MAG: DUF2520 domain-containing protein [Acidobacteria bacterium]|nr:DUF2520 domain-containing protein [Acidobacteriota bacterium]